MSDHVVLLSVPGLRAQDLADMKNVQALTQHGDCAPLVPSFPCVTWPVQANMLTGKLPCDHGVTANGFYWRQARSVEMWTAHNDRIQAPQIWDLLHRHDSKLTSAVWFPMLSKGCGADYICMPAPIHNPDGSESLWCYTRPTEYYGELRDQFGHFPLQNFWGPLAGITATDWIIDTAVHTARKRLPNFFYIYLPHLDYAAQRSGPGSEEARQAVVQLDASLARLIDGLQSAYQDRRLLWLVASEYVIVPVNHVVYPNRVLREAGLLTVATRDDGEYLDLETSDAWALVDHQFAHIYIRDARDSLVRRASDIFRTMPGIAEVLDRSDQEKYHLQHERSGELVLVSEPDSWQAYYWWQEDRMAPPFARTVDIHRKPGYDPVELFWDPVTRGIPLDASLVKGSHGAPVRDVSQHAALVGSPEILRHGGAIRDVELFSMVRDHFRKP